MGIQINGNTDNISATDGGLTVSDLEINQSGISTFNGNIDANGDLDVDGHTELDNVNIAGVTTFANTARFSGGDVIFSGTNNFLQWDKSADYLRFMDGVDATFGNSDDLKIYHSGTDTYIANATNNFRIGNTGSTNLKFFTNNSTRWNIDGSGHFVPDTDSQVDIGTNSVRVRNIYADTLYGDGSNLTGITGTTINNNADNRVITGSGTANTLEGEANLTWDGNDLSLTGTAPAINFIDTDSDDYKIHNVQGLLKITDTTASADRFVINDNGTGYFVNNFQIGSTTTSPGATLHIKSSYPSLKIDDGNNNTNAYIGIIAGTGKESNINFGDPADDDYSQISYDHNGDHMKFKIGGSEKFRVNSNGLCIGGTGSSNALDDYEEGSFTLSASPSSSGTLTLNSSYNKGVYTRVGNLVKIQAYLSFSGNNNATGYLQLSPLPFTVDSNQAQASGHVRAIQVVYLNGQYAYLPDGAGYYNAQLYCNEGQTWIRIYDLNGSGRRIDTISRHFSGGADVFLNFSYLAV